ncbi:pyrroline-5-carboxylate reductase family protein [Sphingomonas japonica]|uniref:pyrroline-5-carboxylate reductase family protein n=1 Tax=Sphingomonas japonica TaxID=511662 RepID=UPI002467FE13|nr:pyrroline-5-carboxylate reductase [Sphingomonas japonica]
MRLWQIGCGNMGGAMLARWIGAGALDPGDVTVIVRSSAEVPKGVRVETALPQGPLPDILLLAVKPYQIDAVAPMLDGRGRLPLLVSILAGVEEAALAERFDATAIVRAMPNLPVRLGSGVVALSSPSADAAARERVTELMAPLGLVEWIDDVALFDLVTALAGSGPGFVYRFIDALAGAAHSLGLPAELALRLAVATTDGAARLAADAQVSPAELADRVASKGGSTRAGLNVLDADNALERLLEATLVAARDRNVEMAATARG